MNRTARAACALLAEAGLTAEVVDYLKQPPDKEELRALLKLLDLRPQQIVRTGEDVYKQLYQGCELDDEAWLDALAQHPILIERPIVVVDQRAVVARPIEKLQALLQEIPAS